MIQLGAFAPTSCSHVRHLLMYPLVGNDHIGAFVPAECVCIYIYMYACKYMFIYKQGRCKGNFPYVLFK